MERLEDIENTIWEYLKDQVPPQNMNGTTKDMTLTKEQVDSMQFLRLVFFLEDRYAIQINENELNRDDFNTIPKIAKFVEKKHSLKNAN